MSQIASLVRPWFMTHLRDEPGTGSLPSKADCVWSEFMAVIDALAPDVRAAFLLHEVFETSYDDIARMIGEPVEVCRTHVEYAREHALSRLAGLCGQQKSPPR
ncbi:sigma factor-like helix-turn-helix DNA-binding protein [Lysobacter panacisoli]|uniref:sigma factor-like helix-turn-helix DNA-binding protein n=1 Tax=Lysobacter panacisoli TaxID=1255263 RepID=UPI00131B4101|nr:sigma factor-like helix-turn-helix DNA-binding protein [Lysobacter panacisoli]